MNKDKFDKIQAHIDNEINKDTFYWLQTLFPLQCPVQKNKSDKHFCNIGQNTESNDDQTKTA